MSPDVADEEHWKTFGRWLRQQRKERTYHTGRPRHELAKLAGVSDNTWGTWERGGRNMGGHWVVYRPRPESLIGIAKALGLPADKVFDMAQVSMDQGLLRAPPVPSAEPVREFDPAMMNRMMATLEQIAGKLDELATTRVASDEVADMRAKLNELLAERPAKRRPTRS